MIDQAPPSFDESDAKAQRSFECNPAAVAQNDSLEHVNPRSLSHSRLTVDGSRKAKTARLELPRSDREGFS